MRRPDYTDVRRCPRIPRCDGTIAVDYSKPWWAWVPHRCESCGGLVAPYVIRFVDPTYLRWAWTWRLIASANRLRFGLPPQATPSVPTLMRCRCGAEGFWYPRTPGICPNPTCGIRWRWPNGS